MGAALVCLSCFAQHCAKPVDKNVAAIINSDTITIAQVDTEFVGTMRKLARSNPFWEVPAGDKLALYRKNTLQRLVNQSIMRQETAKRGIVIDSLRLARGFLELMEKQFRNSEEGLRAYLDKMGLTREQLFEEMRQGLALSALEDSLVRPVQTPDSALWAYYDRHPEQFIKIEREVSHICLYKKMSYVQKPKRMLKLLDVIFKERDSTLTADGLEKARAAELAQERKLAGQLLRRLRSGESFEKLAIQYSEDTTNAHRGGYVRKVPKGYRGYPYSDSAFAVPTGKVTGITEDQYGLFIIRANSDPETTKMLFEDVKERMRKKQDKSKREQLVRELVRKQVPRIYMDTLAIPDLVF